MRIEVCEQNNEKIFQNFVMSHPKSLIYHTVHYKELIKKHLDCDLEYHLLFNNDRVEAILTSMSKIGRFGRVFNALPFFGSNGGILANNKNAYASMIEHYNNLIKGASFATFIENPLILIVKNQFLVFLAKGFVNSRILPKLILRILTQFLLLKNEMTYAELYATI